jgi:hypothetical protein
MENQTLPNGRTQLKCRECGCSVSPTHVPNSEDCRASAIERLESQREW